MTISKVEDLEEYDYFIDTQDGVEQVWEYKFIADKNLHGFVAIMFMHGWQPRGRLIERPQF